MNRYLVLFEVKQKEFPAPQMYEKQGTTYSDITTLFTPSKSASLNDFIEFFRSKHYQDFVSSSDALDTLQETIEEGFKKFKGEDFDGKIISVLHNAHLRDTGAKDWSHRNTLVTFSQNGKFYYALESLNADSENGGSANCKFGEINESKANGLTVDKFGGCQNNWYLTITDS
jgi:hypothetical protein